MWAAQDIAASARTPREFLTHRRLMLILYAGIIPAALGARVVFLGARSFWLDEVSSVVNARLDWAAFVRLLSTREGNMALYYCLLRAWVHLGTDEFTVRALSVLFSVATVPVMYRLGASLFGTRVGIASAALLAANAFHVRYAQEARGYSLAVLLVTLSTLLWVECIERPRWSRWAAYVITSVLAFYTHFFAAFVSAGHGVSLLFMHHRTVPWKALFLSGAAIVLLVLPSVAFILSNDVGQIAWATTTTPHDVRSFWSTLTGGSQLANLVYGLLCANALVQVVTRRYRPAVQSWHFWVVLTGFWTPLLLVLAASAIKPMFVHRFLIVCLPAFIVWAALGFFSIRREKLFIIVVVIVTCMSGYRVVRYHQKETPTAEDWKGATRYILTEARPDEAILFYHPYVRQGFEFYREAFHIGTEPEVVLPAVWDRSIFETDIEQAPTQALLDSLPARYTTVWLVLSHAREIKALGRDVISDWIERSLDDTYATQRERDFTGIRVLRYTNANAS